MTFQRDLAWQQLDLSYRASVAHQMARYALALDYSHLPEKVVHQAKRCVLDALGCAIGAYEAPGRTVCEKTIREFGGPEEATLFCSGIRTSARNAALANSFLVRFLDYCDWGGGGHNAECLPSILAMAEREGANGKDFLTSIVISYEIGARFEKSITRTTAGAAMSRLAGWTKDIRGGLNQPPALGRLMGMNEEQIANAIGLCLSHALPLGILDCDREENLMAKNLRFGWVAHDAMTACMLAKNGFTGPVRIVESDDGIRGVILNGEMDLERLTDFSGWRIMDVMFKTLATNGTSHAHLLSTLAIVTENDLKPEHIAAVNLRASQREAKHTTTPSKEYARNAESADHSCFFTNAIAIRDRRINADSFKPANFTDPVIADLVEKITITADPTLNFYQGASEIITKDGRRFQKSVMALHGRDADPLSDQELEDKFSEMAFKYLSKDHVKKIIDTCWNLDKVDDVGKLTKLMVFPNLNDQADVTTA